ncbi:MAG TPA: aminotransferase class IV [Conexibacter sp.]|jgi:branched-chain amino acid aminotransferase
MSTAHLACLDGTVLPAAEATIPATDDGVLRGDGVFEVVRLYGGRPFALPDHLERLERSALNLRLDLDLDAIHNDIATLLTAAGTGPEHGMLRIVVTRGGRRLLMTESLPDNAAEIRLGSVTYAPVRLLDGIKSLSYAPNMLASRLARERGFGEALLVTPHGRVLEAPTSTLFWARGGELQTTPLEDHVLASITRARVIELTGAQERAITLEELKRADEAFLASTTREVQPVVAVDDVELAAGPITSDVAARLHQRILSELA